MDLHTDFPALPDRLSRLAELSLDLWWTWNNSARQVFRRLDYPLWRATEHNPVRMLRLLPLERFEQVVVVVGFPVLRDDALGLLPLGLIACVTGAHVPCPAPAARAPRPTPASFAASRTASIMLPGSAMFLPAMSKAVP